MGKLVTIAQGTEVRNIANQCGISREKFQELIDSGRFKKFLMDQKVSELLEFQSAVFVEGASHFVASDHFKVGEKGGVKIGWIGNSFQTNFSSKIEENVPEAQLQIHSLKKDLRDLPIITELGGEETAETTLAHMWAMLKKQGRGQGGQLLINGRANVFYIRDANGILWAVRAYWHSASQFWRVEASSLAHPHAWNAGYQVISR